jgi:division protein CdvB (Snf7/Vps24/ESCRT-III family)
LEEVRGSSLYSGLTIRECHLMSRISELLSREEIMEKQRARIDWLKEGDRNTSFFESKSKECARINQITALKRADGSIETTQEALETTTLEFYANLFTRQEVLDPGPILEHIVEKVTPEMNDALLKAYTVEEVKHAVFMMGANKALGPDDLTAAFYQFHRETLGPGITAAVLEFLNGGALLETINSTTIVLIPKVKNPHEMKQFRPISLCNMICKICSKVLANRLRLFLDDVVAEEQSAFVPGRLITDNVQVAYECTHYLQRKKGK